MTSLLHTSTPPSFACAGNGLVSSLSAKASIVDVHLASLAPKPGRISTSATNPLYWLSGHKWNLQCLWRSSEHVPAVTLRSSSHLAATSSLASVATRCATSAAKTSETAKAIATSASISDQTADEAVLSARSATSTDVRTMKLWSRKPKKRPKGNGWRRKATSLAAMRRSEKS